MSVKHNVNLRRENWQKTGEVTGCEVIKNLKYAGCFEHDCENCAIPFGRCTEGAVCPAMGTELTKEDVNKMRVERGS